MAVSTTLSRLEARLEPAAYELIKEASALEGMTVTAFVVGAAKAAAERRIEKHKILSLVKEDQMLFADALLRGPQKPTPAYRAAADLHDRLVRN